VRYKRGDGEGVRHGSAVAVVPGSVRLLLAGNWLNWEGEG